MSDAYEVVAAVAVECFVPHWIGDGSEQVVAIVGVGGGGRFVASAASQIACFTFAYKVACSVVAISRGEALSIGFLCECFEDSVIAPLSTDARAHAVIVGRVNDVSDLVLGVEIVGAVACSVSDCCVAADVSINGT